MPIMISLSIISQGSVVSAIGSGLNAVISAIAFVLETMSWLSLRCVQRYKHLSPSNPKLP